jgi:hypothetical protein
MALPRLSAFALSATLAISPPAAAGVVGDYNAYQFVDTLPAPAAPKTNPGPPTFSAPGAPAAKPQSKFLTTPLWGVSTRGRLSQGPRGLIKR